MWTNLAPEEGNFYVNVAKALTMEYEKACSEFNPQNALPASMNLQEQVFGFGSTFRNQHVAASVPEAPRFTDLSDVQPAGLNHLQMNVFQNWTPECPFQFNPYGQYLNQDHSLPSSSTTPSSPASTSGTTIQDPPAELETSTSETTIQKPEGPPVEEILGMAGYHSSTANKIAEIFKGDWVSAKEWRWTLPKKYHVGQHDIHTVFDILMGNLVLEVPLAGSQLDSVSYIQKDCQACHQTSRENEIHHFSTRLVIRNGQFQKSLQDTFAAPRKISTPCPSCEAKEVLKMRDIATQSPYLVFGFDATPIKDLDEDSEVQMFGSKWKIRSLAERTGEKSSSGHYMAWVRSEEDRWIRVNDDAMEKFEKLNLSRINVKMLVFERI
ncbi:Protein CBG09120 [Caenorhabditis briggsae]|uniref:Protein CBG09120 n=1 Tax=Caenorhabditis briggsae TaxID=6238 RepID=A8X852_CAEBR|nr:Protein CBG09120 [Caenorhabditis briggsae]CAP28813.2 Protein CBG09120 [Caenorhabditis briggsae]